MKNSWLFPIILMLFSALFVALAQIFFKNATGSLTLLLFAGGIITYLGAFATSLVAYKSGELSVLFPITSFALVFHLIFAYLFFGEILTVGKIAGAIVTILGVVAISRS